MLPEINTITGFITILFVFAGVIVLVFLIIKHARKKTKIDMSFNTDIGMCKVNGNKSEFLIHFDAESIVFLVENGNIAGFKTKNSPVFKKYSVGRERMR